MQNKKHQKGFSLLEIMVALAIVAVVATFVVPEIMDRPDEARVVKAKNDISSIKSALKLYKLDNYSYPTTEQGLDALVSKPDDELKNWKPLLESIPKDPWGKNYIYVSPVEGVGFELLTYGADGIDGGEGINATISSTKSNKEK